MDVAVSVWEDVWCLFDGSTKTKTWPQDFSWFSEHPDHLVQQEPQPQHRRHGGFVDSALMGVFTRFGFVHISVGHIWHTSVVPNQWFGILKWEPVTLGLVCPSWKVSCQSFERKIAIYTSTLLHSANHKFYIHALVLRRERETFRITMGLSWRILPISHAGPRIRTDRSARTNSKTTRFLFLCTTPCYFECISAFTLRSLATCIALNGPRWCTQNGQDAEHATLHTSHLLNGHHLGYVAERAGPPSYLQPVEGQRVIDGWSEKGSSVFSATYAIIKCCDYHFQ